MEQRYTIGIDVGGTKIALGLFDENKAIIARERTKTPSNLPPENFIAAIDTAIKNLCAKNGVCLSQISGIGIGMPSFIRRDGYILKTSNIPLLHHFPAGEMLRALLPGIPIVLDNDTHAAALAESRQGAGKGFKDMIFCVVGTGIASAPVIDGKLFRGSDGYSGESGHMLITPGEGILCGCGKRGCLMSYCSGSMIVKHIQSWIANGEETSMSSLAGSPERITTQEICQAFRAGDVLAARAIRQMQKYLAIWFFDLYIFMNINCFVLGGGLLKMGNDLWDGVLEEFHRLNDCDEPVYFKKAVLNDDFGIIGANELLF